jgi:hypothetical protein
MKLENLNNDSMIPKLNYEFKLLVRSLIDSNSTFNPKA